MKIVKARSSKHAYEIRIGKGVLGSAGSALKALGFSGKVLVLTQQAVARRHLAPLRASLKKSGFRVSVFTVPQGEQAKSAVGLLMVYRKLLAEGFERRDVLLSLGGGVVGDLGGFAAATYLRGIAFVNAGTTLLAQVDSSIGGKTGINLPEGKNLAGAFYPPRLVLSDIRALATLPERELRASYAEVIKYGMIRDPELFRILEALPAGKLLTDSAVLEKVVCRSAAIKAGVVGRDEFETRGERMILNYGHTFGHAFESVMNFRMAHGEAVALGMACAARLAVTLGMLERTAELRQLSVLHKLSLPVLLRNPAYRTGPLMAAMKRDKKKRAGKLRFVLPEKIGKVIVRDDITDAQVVRTLREMGAR